AEELLHWVAGDAAPEATVGAGSVEARQQCKRAWEAWWRQQGDKLDFAKVDQDHRRPGLLLGCEGAHPQEKGRGGGSGCDGKPRWLLTDRGRVVDAHLLSGNRVLIAEQPVDTYIREAGKPTRVEQGPAWGVNELDLNGKPFWECKEITDPTACHRLVD